MLTWFSVWEFFVFLLTMLFFFSKRQLSYLQICLLHSRQSLKSFIKVHLDQLYFKDGLTLLLWCGLLKSLLNAPRVDCFPYSGWSDLKSSNFTSAIVIIQVPGCCLFTTFDFCPSGISPYTCAASIPPKDLRRSFLYPTYFLLRQIHIPLQPTLLKYIVQWILVYSQGCEVSPHLIPEDFHHFKGIP